MREERIGTVSHYFNKIGVAAIILEGSLAVGDTIHIKGHSTDFTQKIESIQTEHKNVEIAKERDNIGIKVKDPVREHDIIYKVTG
jgi:translation elongation factor EF-1alpha